MYIMFFKNKIENNNNDDNKNKIKTHDSEFNAVLFWVS